MDKSTAALLRPEQARQLMAELLPARLVPASGRALLAASERGTAPPCVRTGDPPAPRLYDPAVVRTWCLAQQPPQLQRAWRFLWWIALSADSEVGRLVFEFDQEDLGPVPTCQNCRAPIFGGECTRRCWEV